MNRKILFLVGLFLLSYCTHAQRNYYCERPEFLKANSNWIWEAVGANNLCGMNLNTYPPTKLYLNSTITPTWLLGCNTAVSDTATGALLFFSNGARCFNRNYNIMPNGNNLTGVTLANPTASTTQGSCVVPVIGDPNRYYLFSLRSRATGVQVNELRYSIVDMTLDAGLGDIDTNNKAILLSLGEMGTAQDMGTVMIAVPGDNCDVWLLAAPMKQNQIWAYHITESGIDPTPVVSILQITPGFNMSFNRGALTISPDRTKIAISSWESGVAASFSGYGLFTGQAGVVLANFNAQTGQITDDILVNNRIVTNSGTCFSPDNSKLYIYGSDTMYTLNNQSQFSVKLFQYDISNYNLSQILASKILIDSLSADTWGYVQQLRRYRDTIFLTQLYPDTLTGNGVSSNSLNFIAAPNQTGAACNLIKSSYLPFANNETLQPAFRFGNDVVYPLPPDTVYTNVDTVSCVTLAFHVPSGYFNYIWDDNSSNTNRVISSNGTYWLQYDDGGCHYFVDSFHVSITVPDPVITINVLELGTTQPYVSYQWLLDGGIIPNATNSTYTADRNGDYQVVVSNEYGCVDTSEAYTVTNANNSISDVDRRSSQIKLYPNPVSDILYINAPFPVTMTLTDMQGRALIYTEGAISCNLTALAKGIYLIQLRNDEGRLLKVDKIIKQ